MLGGSVLLDLKHSNGCRISIGNTVHVRVNIQWIFEFEHTASVETIPSLDGRINAHTIIRIYMKKTASLT